MVNRGLQGSAVVAFLMMTSLPAAAQNDLILQPQCRAQLVHTIELRGSPGYPGSSQIACCDSDGNNPYDKGNLQLETSRTRTCEDPRSQIAWASFDIPGPTSFETGAGGSTYLRAGPPDHAVGLYGELDRWNYLFNVAGQHLHADETLEFACDASRRAVARIYHCPCGIQVAQDNASQCRRSPEPGASPRLGNDLRAVQPPAVMTPPMDQPVPLPGSSPFVRE